MMEFENLLKLIQTVSDSKLTELRYEEGDVKIKLAKTCNQVQVIEAVSGAGTIAPAQAVSPVTVVEEEKAGNIVESPLVGTFYAAPAEGAAPFVTVGAQVKKGQTLAIVEAMKLMNEIECEYDGTIAEICVENGQPVEYGQPLFRIV